MIVKGGKFRELKPHERDRLYFVGNVEAPVAIGKMGELFDLVDDEFWEIFDCYRWVKSGMLNVEVEKDPALLCNGVRALLELNG